MYKPGCSSACTVSSRWDCNSIKKIWYIMNGRLRFTCRVNIELDVDTTVGVMFLVYAGRTKRWQLPVSASTRHSCVKRAMCAVSDHPLSRPRHGARASAHLIKCRTLLFSLPLLHSCVSVPTPPCIFHPPAFHNWPEICSVQQRSEKQTKHAIRCILPHMELPLRK